MDTSRRMLYPHTLTAKVLQFPFKFYFQNNPLFRHYIYAMLILTPVFYKIQTLTYAPGNVAKAEERKRKEHEEHMEHLKHLL